jgi:hypothetical protein
VCEVRGVDDEVGREHAGRDLAAVGAVADESGDVVGGGGGEGEG